MSNFVEKIGKTVDEAVKIALEELNTTEENVDIEVLEEPTKGLLGLGAKPALVRVSIKEAINNEVEKSPVEDIDKKVLVKEVISDITSHLGLNIKTTVEDAEQALKVNLEGDNLGLVIGYKGETLDALQLLTNVIINKNGDYKRVEIDAQNYREKRKETLISLAHKKARDVVKYGKNITLEPMSPYERRIIHTALQDDTKVTTMSVGSEPFRKVVIKKA